MDKTKSGSGGIIINLASIAAMCKNHQYTTPIYSATKAGIITLSKGLGHEFHVKRTGVKIMVLCPAGTDTPFFKNIIFLNDCLPELFRLNNGKEFLK